MKITSITETTTSGAIAPISQPFAAVQKRAAPKELKGSNLLKGIKTSAKYANSLHEGESMCKGCGSAVCECSLDEKAVSKKQQQFFGMAHALQKGEKIKGASKELKKVAKSMGKQDVKDFASTKHSGLPTKVQEDAGEDAQNAADKVYNRLTKVKEQGVAEGEVVAFPKKHPYELLTKCTKCSGPLQGGRDEKGRMKMCVPCLTIYRAPNQQGVEEGWKEKVAAGVLAGAMATGASAAMPASAYTQNHSKPLTPVSQQERDKNNYDMPWTVYNKKKALAKANAEVEQELKKNHHKHSDKVNKEGVAQEGIGDTIKRGIKSVKRGMQGWDKNSIGPNGEELGNPKDIVRRNKAHDDATVKRFHKIVNTDKVWDHTPGGLQKRVLDREMKKRGLAQEGVVQDPSKFDLGIPMAPRTHTKAGAEANVKRSQSAANYASTAKGQEKAVTGYEKQAARYQKIADNNGEEIAESDLIRTPGKGRQFKPGLLNKPEVSLNPTDTVKLDVPLLIRLLEFAKEDAVDDMALHDLAEKLIAGCARGKTLSMKDYDSLVSSDVNEVSTDVVKSYVKGALHDTITGKKDRNSGLTRAISRLSGTNKPLINPQGK